MDPSVEWYSDEESQLFLPLASFSEDVLAQITAYLSGFGISQLLCTGNALLSAKLMQGGMYDVICIGEPVLKLMKPAIGIKTIRLAFPSFQGSFWTLLPPNARHIVFGACKFTSAPDSRYHAPQIESISMKNHEDLQNFPSLDSCFSNLKLLNLESSSPGTALEKVIQGLPKGIQTLSLPTGFIRSDWISTLPSTLTSLNCRLLLLDSNISGILPSTLTYFKALTQETIEDSETFSKLPISLESLHLDVRIDFAAPNFAYIPSGITSLSFQPVLTMEGTCLPPKLRNLDILYHIMSNTACLELPSSLEHIKLVARELTDDGLRNLPANLKTIQFQVDTHFTDNFAQFLPSNLQSLTSCSPGFTDALIPMLPRGLTHLELPSVLKFSNGCVRHLPRSLTNLVLDRAYELNSNCLADFPPYLTRLSLFGNVVIRWQRLIEIPLKSVYCVVFLNASSFRVQDQRVGANRVT